MIKAASRAIHLARQSLRLVNAKLSAKRQPAILMYHRVSEDPFNRSGTIVRPEKFAEQIEWLSANRQVVPLTRFAELHCDNNLPDDAVAITFDDGYPDNADVAAPLLVRFNAPATIFLPTRWMKEREPFWWDRVARVVLDHDGPFLKLGGSCHRLGTRGRDDRVWKHAAPPRTDRQRAFAAIWDDLLARNSADLMSGIADLESQFVACREAKDLPLPMSIEQMRALRPLIDFGSHTRTHPDLTRLEPAEREREIHDSIAECEALTGERPRTFAYPFGIFDEQVMTLVQRQGFTCACSTVRAAVRPDSPRFALPRVQVGNWGAREMAARLALL